MCLPVLPYEVNALQAALDGLGATDSDVVFAAETGRAAVVWTEADPSDSRLNAECVRFTGFNASVLTGDGHAYSGICFPEPAGLDETWTAILSVVTIACTSGQLT